MAAADVRRVLVGAGSAVAASAAWYTAFGRQLARYDEAYADDSGSPAWLLPVELVRSGAVATALAVLADRAQVRGPVAAAGLGRGLWASFPVVLLTGSVVHEKVPWQQAAIHAGDWLAKLLLVSAVVGRRRRARRPRSRRPRSRR